jgi:hypothetical protein
MGKVRALGKKLGMEVPEDFPNAKNFPDPGVFWARAANMGLGAMAHYVPHKPLEAHIATLIAFIY